GQLPWNRDSSMNLLTFCDRHSMAGDLVNREIAQQWGAGREIALGGSTGAGSLAHSGGQSPQRFALSRVEIVCSKPAIGIVISVTDSKCESVIFVTAILPLAPFEHAIRYR